MKITKTKKELVIKVPLEVKRSNPWDDNFNEPMDNILGVICGDEIGFAHWIDMDYKGKEDQISTIWLDYGGGEEDDFKKLCKELDIYLYEYPLCGECNKPIYGASTWNKGKNICFDCDKK